MSPNLSVAKEKAMGPECLISLKSDLIFRVKTVYTIIADIR